MNKVEKIISAVKKYRIIAILRGVPSDKLLKTAQALYDGGIRMLEITFSPDKSVSDYETSAGIELLVKNMGDKMFIGAGTVLTVDQVRLVKNAGGDFIISPNTDKDVIFETKSLDMVSIPGALTPTEICSAHEFGADFVKLFPITSMGPAYVKAVKAPLSHIDLLAVGGVDENNMRDYLSAGVCGFGLGSNLVSKKLVESEDYDAIRCLAEKFVKAI